VTETCVPALVAEPTTGNTISFLVEHATQDPGRVLISRRVEGIWQDVTAGQFLTEVTDVARGLLAAGIQVGDRVGLLSATRYEWTLVDFAVWSVGAVTVPIYETSSAEQIEWILRDSGAVACVVEKPAHAKAVGAVRSASSSLNDVWQIDAGGLADLVAAGADIDPVDVRARRLAARPGDLATLIYTSGTTGRPKGCELTHLSFMTLSDNAVASLSSILKSEGSCTLLFLPLAHVFARFVQVLAIRAGTRLGHSSDIKNLLPDLQQFRPTFFLAVPRVFEKIYNSVEAKAQAAGRGRSWIFEEASRTAVSHSRAAAGAPGGPGLRVKHVVFDHLVYSRLRRAMGGRLRYAVSGGAPLGERLGHFFNGAGITVLEGYGLTETTAPCTVNTPEVLRIGTVGRPLPGVSLRIADDGEILVRGPHVLRGYWNNAAATNEAIVDGWFRTGDLGSLDTEGVLKITGRKKEILVTASGKNVAPAFLEDRLRAHPLVSQCIVVGDQRPFVAALVTLDSEMLPGWLANAGRPVLGPAEASRDPGVREEINRAVDAANQGVSKAESIRKFHLLEVDFTEEGGYLTPSLKLRRRVVMDDFAEQVENLYR
jgi:long-chain acyl-CoA synthetase